jgi:1-acyl-sn-glycerol-3-phosphate acyltransferase
MIDGLLRRALAAAASLLTGVRALWAEPPPEVPCVFYGNHVSHGDFLLLWSVLPPSLRARTRPVAGADYWDRDPLRRYVGRRVVRAVLIERERDKRTDDPIAQMDAVLAEGSHLILFPEGTRNLGDVDLLPFKSGLYHLACRRPELPLVPAWIDNLHRVLPKGEFLPIPLLCTVRFGRALTLAPGEDKAAFLDRARAALLALKPEETVRD